MKKLIWSLHSGEGEPQKLIDTVLTSSLPKPISAFLAEHGLSVDKHKGQLQELASTNFILAAMCAAEKIKQSKYTLHHRFSPLTFVLFELIAFGLAVTSNIFL